MLKGAQTIIIIGSKNVDSVIFSARGYSSIHQN